MQMFEGVEAAHEAGIVHRDLKPDNVMITIDAKGAPLLKLLDFGIAKLDEPPESATGPALTRPGVIIGTPEYMAPEQAYSADSADARSDIFSLGVIIFEMLAGRRPVRGDDPQQIAVAYLTGAFTRLAEACPGVPPALAAAVHRAMAAQPRDRFASVAEMRDAIEPFAPPRPPSPSRLSLVGTMLPGSVTSTSGHVSSPGPAGHDGGDPQPPRPSRRAGLPSHPRHVRLLERGPRGERSDRRRGDDHHEVLRLRRLRPSPGAPTSAFVPEYPPMIAPYSVAPAIAASPIAASPITSPIAPSIAPFHPFPNAAPEPARQSFAPEYPPAVAAMPTPPPSIGGWAPPAPARHGAVRRTSGVVWAGIALASLLVAAGITLGVLYYLGWLDPNPPVRPRKPVPTKPAPTHQPPGSTLR